MELESELALKKEIIERLKEEVMNIRNEFKIQQMTDIEEELKNGRSKGKAKGANDLNITTSGDNEVSLIEPAVNEDRKIVNDGVREVKTMNKLNERSRRIFN